MKVSELSESDQKKLKEIEAKDRLTRSDLFTLVSLNLRLAEGTGAPNRAEVEKVSMELLGTAVRVVQGGKSISITGFGTFTASQSPSRIARNPQTGEKFRTPAKWFPPPIVPSAASKSVVSR
jgi:nucleoid DNA-binding protein